MKTSSRAYHFRPLPLLTLIAASGQLALADPLFWDTNASSPGSGNSGGSWDSGTNWTTDPAGASETVAWVDGSAVIFAAGDDFALAAKTITIGGIVRIPSITLKNEGLVTLSGGSLDLSGNTLIDTSVFGAAANRNLNWSTLLTGEGDLTLAVNGGFPDAGGGNTIFTLSGNNDFQGRIAIRSGVVGWSSGFGDPTNPIILDGGGLLHNTGGTFQRDIEVGPVGGIRLYGAAATVYLGSVSNLAGVESAEIRRTDGGSLTLAGDGSGFSGTFVNARGITNFVSENWHGTSLTLIQGQVNYRGTFASAEIQAGTARIGALSGGLSQSGGLATIPGPIAGDILLDGGTLNLGSAVDGTVVFSGGTLNLESGSSLAAIEFVPGPTRVLSIREGASIDGDVVTDFETGGVRVDLAGSIAGKVVLDDNSGLGLRGGSIGGNLETGYNSFSRTPWIHGDTLRVEGDVRVTGVQELSFFEVPAPGEAAILIEFAGSLTGDGANPLEDFALEDFQSYREGVFSLSEGNLALDIGGTSLAWVGVDSISPGTWDAGFSENWSGGDSRFFNGDAVTFGNVNGERNIAMGGVLSPHSLIIDNDEDHPYVIAGGGRLAAVALLEKSGSGTATLGGANGQDFTGPIRVREGTLMMGSRDAFGMTSGITIEDGARVDINNQRPGNILSGGYTYRISGHGPDGNGAIILGTSPSVASNAGIKTLILEADATLGAVGGPGARFDVGFANTAGFGEVVTNGHTITVKGPGSVYFRGPATNDFQLVVEGARVAAEDFATAFGGVGGEVSILEGSQAFFYTGAVYHNGFTIEGEGWPEALGSLGAIRLQGGAEIAGPIRLSGDAHIHARNTVGILSGVVSETGGSHSLKLANSQVNTTSTLTLSNANTYSGGTLIEPAPGAGLIVRATSDSSFGSGPVAFKGSAPETGALPNARIDLLDVSLENDLELDTAGLGTVARGVLNTAQGNSLSVVNGEVLIRSGVGSGGHFSSADGGILRINGAIRAADGVTPVVRSGSVELAGGGDYAALVHGEGTLRLRASDGVNPGASLRLGASAASTFDLNGHDQTLAELIRASDAQATVTNLGSSPSRLTLHAVDAYSFNGFLTDGSGGLSFTKSGPGTLQLSGAHTYRGDTTVADGTLSLAIPFLADASAIRLSAGAVLNLNHGETDVVRALFVDGVQQDAGTYSSESSFITGPGSLQVSTGPDDNTASPYKQWARSFGLDPLLPSGAPEGDFDQDGLPNIVEFLLGSAPNAPSLSAAPEVAVSQAGIVFTYRRSKAVVAAGYLPAVEYSSTLVDGAWEIATPAMTAIEDDRDFEQVTVTIPRPPAATSLFARLRVTAP